MPSRRLLVPAAVLVVAAGLLGGGFEVALGHAAEGCHAVREGYLTPRVVAVDRRWWTVDCRLDPLDGDPVYTVHRPWQSVRDIPDIDGDG
ncbi:hypothetical protein [Nocardioides litoris]|uniref:hypothetical protein n=1 Tax=Nocardioides litoris TaxID=1926648 RepID=UPI001120C5AE|nr:hypothetical protein [Nocardioides litoris]